MHRHTDSLGKRLGSLLACSLLLASATFAASPQELRDAYLQWRGGDAFLALKGRHSSGTIQVSTLSGTFERWEDAAGRYRLDVLAKALKISDRVTSKGGFSLTPGGQVETLSVKDCESRIASVLSGYADLLRGGQGCTLSAVPVDAPEGERLEGFRVTHPNGSFWDFHVRPTGELVRCREVIQGEENTTTFSDWRTLNGVRLPYSSVTIAKADGQKTVLILKEEQLNPTLEASLFGRPEESSHITFAAGTHDSGSLPFELFAGNRVFFHANIGGRDTTVLLDSGAEVSVIDTEFAREAGIKATGSMDIRGTGGSQNTEISSDVPVKVGGLTLRTGMVVIMDLSQIARMIDHPVKVILGKEVLNQTVTDLDFEKRTIVFHDPARFTPPAGMTRVPLTVAAGIRTVPIRVEGHEPVDADFDLGNGTALMLFPKGVENWKLLNGRPAGQRLGGGVGGMHVDHVFTLSSLSIGDFTFKNVPVQTPAKTEGLAVTTRESVLGNVGMPIWSRFHLIMDFSRNQLLLSSTRENLERPFVKNRSGLQLVREGDAFKVLFVDAGFGAPVCKVGDEIIAINEVAVSQLRSTQTWAEAPAGTKVTLRFRDGHQATVTLREYF